MFAVVEGDTNWIYGKLVNMMRILIVALLAVLLVGCGADNELAEVEVLITPDTGVVDGVAVEENDGEVGSVVPTSLPVEGLVEPGLLGYGWADREVFRPGLVRGEQGVLDGLAGATVYHLVWEIGADLTTLTGRAEILYTNREGVELTEVFFHLLPNYLGGTMTFDGVRVDGDPAGVEFLYGGGAMAVTLAETLAPGERVVLGMSYELTIPQGLGEGFGMLGFSKEVLSLAHGYPMVAVYDEVVGWHSAPPAVGGDVTFGDSAFFVVEVGVPAGVTSVAVGSEVGREGDRVTYAAGPVRDFYLAASASFVTASEQVGETTINTYVVPELVEENERAIEQARESLVIFNEQIGAYPYTELDIVSTDLLALGLEFPGLFAIAQHVYDDEGPYPPVVLESTVVHEMAHQWFYSTIGNDQINEPWLDEALAQYATWLYFGERYGPAGADGFRQSLTDRWLRVGQAEIPIGLPVAEYQDNEYGAIVYGRGPLFVEALAGEMGEAAFAEFLRDYYETFKWGIATTADFRGLAEAGCGCDLAGLFGVWVGDGG